MELESETGSLFEEYKIRNTKQYPIKEESIMPTRVKSFAKAAVFFYFVTYTFANMLGFTQGLHAIGEGKSRETLEQEQMQVPPTLEKVLGKAGKLYGGSVVYISKDGRSLAYYLDKKGCLEPYKK